MVGKVLVQRLLHRGDRVSILSTQKNAKVEGAAVYHWNPQDFEMDANALNGVDVIINLAGATVSKRWTVAYKQEIFDSRTRSAETIFRALSKREDSSTKAYISASGVNYYPSSFDKTYTEEDQPANDFLGQVCQHWELGADKFKALNLQVMKLRIGVVLSREGGAIQKLEPLTNFAVNAPVGSGNQWMSWIHIDDLVNMIIYGIDQKLDGVYNAVSPNAVTNKRLTKALGKAMNRPVILPNVPAAVLKLMLGEMSVIVLEGAKCSASKVLGAGFKFQHENVEEALADLYAS